MDIVKFSTIPCVHAEDMPDDVVDFCIENDIQIHYQNDVALIKNTDDTPLSNWLRSIDIPLDTSYNYIAIIAT